MPVIDCPDCKGTGKNSKAVVGRVSTYSRICQKCEGKGQLYPVTIELEPANMTAKPSLGSEG